MNDTLKLSTPWCTYYEEMKAMFGKDPDITIQYDDEEKVITLRVADSAKADALSMILPMEKVFGNVTVQVKVVPANTLKTRVDAYTAAFRNNPVLSYIQTVESPFGRFSFAVFAKEVVQFYNDDISDLNGLESTLYEDIARDIFEGESSMLFCTDTE